MRVAASLPRNKVTHIITGSGLESGNNADNKCEFAPFSAHGEIGATVNRSFGLWVTLTRAQSRKRARRAADVI